MSTVEKINSRLISIFTFKTCPDSNLTFPGLLFPSFHFWSQPHWPCHWLPNRRTSAWPRFLTECPHTYWRSLCSAHPNSVHGLLMSFFLCEAAQTAPAHTHHALLCIHMVSAQTGYQSCMFCLHSASPLILLYFIISASYIVTYIFMCFYFVTLHVY